MWARRVPWPTRLFAAPVLLCERPDGTTRRQGEQGVVIVTNQGCGSQMKTLLMHLHGAGIHHVAEVRRIPDAGSARSCKSDRQVYRLVEEIVNSGVLRTDADLHYRCLDILNGPGVDGTSANDGRDVKKALAPIVESLNSHGVRYVAALPEPYESLVALTDSLAHALAAPTVANDPTSSQRRIDKDAMQEALQRSLKWGARQASVSSAAEVPRALASAGLEFPVIVKPVSSAASDGVFFCADQASLVAAVERDLDSLDIYQRPIERVVIQEYFQGQEYVVNTVSVQGRHRVVDMWEAHKQVRGEQITYGHQLLVPDSRAHDDVVQFCFSALDAVGFAGGAAHLEVVRTRKGVRLIEVNPRFAGHGPRSTKLVGEDQFSALAQAVAEPQAFIAQAVEDPHYTLKGPSDHLMCVVFLAADKDAEVSRSHLLEIIGLDTFKRFDRTATPMFAEVVREEEPGTFWVVSQTRGLFTAPLTVLLQGAPAALSRDLQRIRALERRMYKPFGSYDPTRFVGALEGGNTARWFKHVLPLLDVPADGTRIRVLPGQEYQGNDGRTDYYRAGDYGTVTSSSEDRVVVAWHRTGMSTATGKLAWSKAFERVSEELPTVGQRVRVAAVPGELLRVKSNVASGTVFTSLESWQGIGTVVGGQCVTARDVPQVIEGFTMLPIEPEGAVEFSLLDNVPGRSGIGTVTGLDHTSIYISWDRTWRTSKLPRAQWQSGVVSQ